MLTSLRHLTIGGTHDENGTIHLIQVAEVSSADNALTVKSPTNLRGTSDHVLDVIGVARAVNVSIVTVIGFVLDMRR
jgi:hypothetical protein